MQRFTVRFGIFPRVNKPFFLLFVRDEFRIVVLDSLSFPSLENRLGIIIYQDIFKYLFSSSIVYSRKKENPIRPAIEPITGERLTEVFPRRN